MLNAGWFTAAAGIWRRDDDLDRQVRFPIPAYVIETAEERILVDTGLHPAAVADAARHYGSPTRSACSSSSSTQSVAEQVDLTTITKVVLTHLHFDHAGGLALLPPSVPVVVQRREWEAGHDAAGGRAELLPAARLRRRRRPGRARRRRPRPARRRIDPAAARRPVTRPATSRSASASGSSSAATSPTSPPAWTTTASRCSPTTSPRRRRRPTACARFATPEPSSARDTTPPFSCPVRCR